MLLTLAERLTSSYKKQAGFTVNPACPDEGTFWRSTMRKGSEHPLNGQAGKPAKPSTPRKPRVKATQPPPDPAALPKVSSALTGGVVLSKVKARSLEWFLDPWIPKGMLSLVVGRPNTGKSSFLAWIMSQAKRVVLMPGFEEVLEVLMLPRFVVHGVNLDNVLCLNDQHYSPQDQKDLLIRQIRSWRADLVVIETVDSYLPGDCSENDGQAVRPFLEALETIAEQTGAAVIGSRHPGKDADNVMRGSQAWGAVPRVQLELVRDDGPPIRRFIRPYKYGVGPEPASQSFELVTSPGLPPVFKFGLAAERSMVDLARDVPDALDRSFVQMAEGMLRALLSDSEKESSLVLMEGRKEGLSERTVYRAAKSLGVVISRKGQGREHKSHWSLPGVTPPPLEPDKGGVGVGEGGSEAVGVSNP